MTTRYITQTKLTSLVGSELTYPDGRKVTSEYDSLYRRTKVTETSTSADIASWQFIGPSRSVETVLANGITRTSLNNARTHSAVQAAHGSNPTVPNPVWGTASSDRLGFDGSGRPITKRYLAGGINSSTHAYNNTAPIVGQTTIYDRASNKMYERALHAEPRSALYDPFDIDTGSAGGYDSINRLRQYQRGTLNSTNGYLNQGGGKVTAPIALPDTDTHRTYDLDGLGNWKHSNYTPVGGSATEDLRQHNKLNKITRRVGLGLPSSGVVFAYDKNGNLQDDGTLLYEYDALNRLTQVSRKTDSATIGQYVYDAQNRRIQKTVSNGGLSGDLPNGTTTYLYHNWQIIEERDSNDETTKQYVWGEYIDELIQMKTAVASGGGNLPAGDYYPLQDLLYRNTALTDSAGAIVETYDTDAYGNTLVFKAAGAGGSWWADDAVQTDNPACEVIYAGYRYDPESELYYVRHRTYNPVLGRWLQRDPVGYVDGMNLYQYVQGNPTFAIDYEGLSCTPGEECCVAGNRAFVQVIDVHPLYGQKYTDIHKGVMKGLKSGAKKLGKDILQEGSSLLLIQKFLHKAKTSNLITGATATAIASTSVVIWKCNCHHQWYPDLQFVWAMGSSSIHFSPVGPLRNAWGQLGRKQLRVSLRVGGNEAGPKAAEQARKNLQSKLKTVCKNPC